ncbi:hypothetical protein GCM10009603_67190 [Nocardiopsis exhalans]
MSWEAGNTDDGGMHETPRPRVSAYAAVLVVLALATTACLPAFGPGPEPASEVTTDTEVSEDAQNPEPSPESEAAGAFTAEPPEDQSHLGSATWAFPFLLDWESETRGNGGLTILSHDASSCQVSLYQNQSLGVQGDPQSTLDAFASSAEDNGATGLAVTPQPVVELRDFGGSTAQFQTELLEYTGQDGHDYTMRVSAQWFEHMELIVASSCQSADFTARSQELDEVMDGVEVQRYV